MMKFAEKSLPFIILLIVSCSKETVTKTEYIEVPRVQTIEVPVTVPGTNTIIKVPQTVLVDKGFGIKTLPRPISEASEKIQNLGKAVAKVLKSDGSSGTGFFISEDGLFLTNEHVIPMSASKQNGCPGTKLIRDFRADGENETFSEFEVLAQSGSTIALDFTLLRVKLKEGRKTPFLELELTQDAYQFSTDDKKNYLALGYPGGASLRFTNARPVKNKGLSIELLGLLIGGNSGGPLIDEESGKVVGLVKARRTSYQKDDQETSSHQSRGFATSILDLVRNLENLKLPPEIFAKINSKGIKLRPLESYESVTVVTPPKEFKKPSRSLFLSAFRKGADDPNQSRAIDELDKYIGTPVESEVLDMMFEKTDLYGENLDEASLASLFKKQILLGRPLKISQKNIDTIFAEISGKELDAPYVNLPILINFFNEDEKLKMQTKCRGSIPSYEMAYLAIIFSCVTNSRYDGTSLIPKIVENLKNAKYEDAEDFGVAMALGMYISIPGISREDDKKSLLDLAKFLEEKNKDVEMIVQNDAFLMNAIIGINAPGSFSDAFPKAQ